MGSAKGVLGIIVNSNRYFDFVTQLAEAAVDKDKVVRIHLLGHGCEFAVTEACSRVSRRAQITMCAKSASNRVKVTANGGAGSIPLVPPQELTKLLNTCDRYVVF